MVLKQLKQNKVGAWAFVLGVIIAVIAGFIELNTTMASILVVLGIVVGLLNITGKEGPAFLVAGAVLVIVTAFGKANYADIAVIGQPMSQIMEAIMTLIVPATIITSLRALFSHARN